MLHRQAKPRTKIRECILCGALLLLKKRFAKVRTVYFCYNFTV